MELTAIEQAELEKAVQELEAVTEPPAQEKAEITAKERLSKAIEGLAGFFKKSTATQEPSTDGKAATQEETTLTKGQTVSDTKTVAVEIEVEKLFEDMRITLAKSVATVDGHVDELSKAVGMIGRGMLVLCETQKKLHDMLEATPKTMPMSGVIQNGKGRDDGSEDVKKSAVSMGTIRQALTRAANDGKIDPQYLGLFHTQPQRVLELLPEEVSKSYGIPRTLQ